MKRLFRSIIDIPNKDGKASISQDELCRNYRSFKNSNIQAEDPSYIKLYHWMEAHFREYKEIPSIQLLFQRAEKDGDEGVIASLKDIVTEIPYIRSNYQSILKEKFDEQSRDTLQKVLQNTWTIVTGGLKIGKKEIKGINSAVEYFVGESRRFRMGSLDLKTESNIRDDVDGNEVMELYTKRKENPLASLGMYTFLDRIDVGCRGLKPGELMLVAGFVKQGKTILSANLAYNGIMQGKHGLFVSLEMSFEEMRNLFYVLHSTNPDWMSNNRYKHLIGKITYDKVIYGELTSEEEEFFQIVVKDFTTRKDFGNLFLYQPTEHLTSSKLEMLAYDYDSRLKDMDAQLDFLIPDYIGLMNSDKEDRYGDYNIDLNMIIKRLKQLALTFDSGRKLRIISPFQINRAGYTDAEKNDGRFKISALSNANEAERSSDVVITTYMPDEMKKAGIIRIGCLLTRRGPGFESFEAKIDFGTRHISDLIQRAKPEDRDKFTGVQNIPLDS